MSANDSQLIAQLKRREPEAIFSLYTEYRGRVFAVVRKIVRDEWDAEEVVQDVFWTVHRKIDLFREDSALWSWIYRIAVNAAKMKVRKYTRRPVPIEDQALHDLHARDASQGPHELPEPEQVIMHNWLLAQMDSFLSDADVVNRTLYLDMEFDGRSKEEVAQKLDLSIPAVKTRLHRMRAGMREHVEAEYEAQKRSARL